MNNKENGIFVNTLLDLLQNDDIIKAIDERIIKMSKEVAYRNIELEQKIDKAINYLKSEKNFDGELFLHTDRLVQKVLLGILENEEGKEL